MKNVSKNNSIATKNTSSFDSAFNTYILPLFSNRKPASVVAGSSPQVTLNGMPNKKMPKTNQTLNLGFSRLIGLQTHIGRRATQQDAMAVSKMDISSFKNEKFIAVLCDGMGGMNGGERASSLCVEQFVSKFAVNTDAIPTFYRNTIVDVDSQVASLKDDNGNYLGGGSTLVSVVVDDNKLYWGSVGDSHIYILRGNDMVLVTKEHNYMLELMEQVKKGEITIEQANADKEKEALISYMGMGSVSLMDVIEKPFELQKNDVIILCSDGLYRSVSDEEIAGYVRSEPNNMQALADKLVDCALSKNNPYQDNTSVIVIKYQ